MSHAVVSADREELVQCPYDPVHMISQMRLPYHLIKCRKNHSGKEYQQCPYDGKHVILKARFQDHIRDCDKKAIIEPQLVLEDSRNIDIPESKAHEIQMTLSNEWDLDVPSAATTNFQCSQTFHTLEKNSRQGHCLAEVQGVNSFGATPTTSQLSGNSSLCPPSGATFHLSNETSQPYQNGAASRFPTNKVTAGALSGGISEPKIPRKPNKQTTKMSSDSKESISKPFHENSENTYNPQKSSFGRGRVASQSCAQNFSLQNSQMGPSSYQIESNFSGHTDCFEPSVGPTSFEPTPGSSFEPTPVSSFGRGRGSSKFAEQSPVRRPGFTEKQSLDKEKQKLLKKIRECKALEERLHAGEVLEQNQVIIILMHCYFQ